MKLIGNPSNAMEPFKYYRYFFPSKLPPSLHLYHPLKIYNSLLYPPCKLCNIPDGTSLAYCFIGVRVLQQNLASHCLFEKLILILVVC